MPLEPTKAVNFMIHKTRLIPSMLQVAAGFRNPISPFQTADFPRRSSSPAWIVFPLEAAQGTYCGKQLKFGYPFLDLRVKPRV